MRTYTVTHSTGVTFTSRDLDVAVALTGWGWQPSPEERHRLGVDFTGARTKADLTVYAADLLIDLDGARTRDDVENRIRKHHRAAARPRSVPGREQEFNLGR